MKEDVWKQVENLERRFHQGEISRRDFLRFVGLFGLSIGAEAVLTACGNATASPYPTDPFLSMSHPAEATAEKLGRMLTAKESTTPAPPTIESSAAASLQPVSETVTPQPTSTPAPKIEWLCLACGGHFPTLETLKYHVSKFHATRLPLTLTVEEPTYKKFIVGKIERFDEKNTALSRAAWDVDYQTLLQQAVPKQPRDPMAALDGAAQLAGAIYVDDTVGVLDERYYGYMGHRTGKPGLYSWEDPVSDTKYPVSDPAAMAEHVKEVARFYGADLVGICEINPNWIYSNTYTPEYQTSEKLEISYKYAIIMAVQVEWKHINQSPGLEASAAIALGYSRMAELAATMAKYIRALGYPAIPCGNDTAQTIPLAIDAGLGELGRSGLLITPEFGSRQRLCKVLTNIPLATDKPIDFGMSTFCETCFACAHSCPAKAIQNGERTTEITSISNRKGLLRWPVDTAKCYIFWRENGTDCSNCISACPWSLPSTRDWLEL